MARRTGEIWALLIEFVQICLDLVQLAGKISKTTFRSSTKALMKGGKYVNKIINARVEVTSPDLGFVQSKNIDWNFIFNSDFNIETSFCTQRLFGT